MLQPKRTKFRKMHKGRIHGMAKGGSDLTFGTWPKSHPARADHRAPDRSGAAGDDPSNETAGPGLDPDFPRYAGHV